VVKLPSFSSVFIFVALLDSDGHLFLAASLRVLYISSSLHPWAPFWVALVGCSSFLAWLLFYSDDGRLLLVTGGRFAIIWVEFSASDRRRCPCFVVGFHLARLMFVLPFVSW